MEGADLRVSNDDQLGVGALLIEVVDCVGNVLCTLLYGGGVGGIGTASCRVHDSLCSRAWVGIENEVDKGARRSIAGRSSGLSSTKDVDVRARLALLKLDGTCNGSRGDCQQGCCTRGQTHFDEVALLQSRSSSVLRMVLTLYIWDLTIALMLIVLQG